MEIQRHTIQIKAQRPCIYGNILKLMMLGTAMRHDAGKIYGS